MTFILPAILTTRRMSRLEDIDECDPPPEKPDCSEMMEEDAFDAMKHWKKQCKVWTDRHARRCRRNMSSLGIGDFLTYSCDACPIHRLMSVIQQCCLVVGDTFQLKETLSMHIAEEANLRGVEISMVHSNKFQLLVVGVEFYVQASFSECKGWVIC